MIRVVQSRRLGEILLEMGAVDVLQLKSALAHQAQWGTALGKALVELGFCSTDDVMRAFALQTGHPVVDLDNLVLDPSLAALLPSRTAERHRAVPLRVEGKRQELLVVAVAAPGKMDTLDALRTASAKAKVIPHLASDDAIERALGELYHGRPRVKVQAAPVVALPNVYTGLESVFDLDDKQATDQAPPVLLHGWHDARQRALAEMLKLGGVQSAPLSDDALESCPPSAIIISSTLALQACLSAQAQPLKAKVVVCGLAKDLDMQDAKRLGVSMYLRPPFSPEQLRNAVDKLRLRTLF